MDARAAEGVLQLLSEQHQQQLQQQQLQHQQQHQQQLQQQRQRERLQMRVQSTPVQSSSGAYTTVGSAYTPNTPASAFGSTASLGRPRTGQDEYCSSGSFGYRSAQGLGGTPRVNGVSDMLFSAGASPAPGLLSTGAGLSGYSSRLGGLSATAAGLSGLGRGSSLSPNQQQQLAQDRRIANAMLR
jgi:hypothetical protein